MNKEHTFCCGGKSCPTVKQQENGGITLSDAFADVPAMTVKTDAVIAFNREQASELKLWLQEHGY